MERIPLNQAVQELAKASRLPHKKKTKVERAIRAGLNIHVGPLRIYVNTNRDGMCEVMTVFEKTSLGRFAIVPEEVLIQLIEQPDVETKRGPHGS